MIKKTGILLFSVFLLINISGCFALFAGAVGGAGTAAWLSGKLTQQFNASFDRTVEATDQALKSLNLPVTSVTKEASVAKYRSVYNDGKEIWIDINWVTDTYTKVEVRVGGVNPDKAASAEILKRIQSYL